MFKKPFIIIAISINSIPFSVTNEASLFNFKVPLSNFTVFGFLFIQENTNNQTVCNHNRKETKKKINNIIEGDL